MTKTHFNNTTLPPYHFCTLMWGSNGGSISFGSKCIDARMSDAFCLLLSQLRAVRGLLQKTAPMLLSLNERAAAALRERDEHLAARDEAVEERDQVK